MPTATPVPARPAAWKWWVCGLLLLATMINYMDRLTLNLTARRIKDYLLLSHEQYGQVEFVFGMAFAGGALVFGWVADRWNVRTVYALSLFAWSAAGFATGFAGTFAGLLVCRGCLGLFEAGNWPCALRTTQRVLPPAARGMGNGILQSGAALGAIITPLVVQTLVAGTAGPWLPHFLAADVDVRPEHLAALAAAPGAPAPGGLSWAGLFFAGREGSWRYPFFVVGLVGTAWVVVWLVSVRPRDLALATLPAAKKGDPAAGPHEVSLAGVWRDPRFWVLIVLVVTVNLTWHFFRVWLPLFLAESRGYNERTVNYFTAAYYAATDAGSLTAGFATLLLARAGWSVHGSRVAVFTACATLTLLSVAVAFLPAGPLLLGLLLVLGFGALGLFPVYYSLNQEITVRHQGKLTGLLGFTTWVVTATMHPAVGRWIDRTHDYSTVVAIAGLFPLLGVAALLLGWRRPATA